MAGSHYTADSHSMAPDTASCQYTGLDTAGCQCAVPDTVGFQIHSINHSCLSIEDVRGRDVACLSGITSHLSFFFFFFFFFHPLFFPIFIPICIWVHDVMLTPHLKMLMQLCCNNLLRTRITKNNRTCKTFAWSWLMQWKQSTILSWYSSSSNWQSFHLINPHPWLTFGLDSW